MADNSNNLPKLDFGEAIAFLLPGFPLLRAAGYLFGSIQQLWLDALTADKGAGVYVIVVFLALSGGVAVSTVRSAIESLILRIPRVRERFGLDYSSYLL